MDSTAVGSIRPDGGLDLARSGFFLFFKTINGGGHPNVNGLIEADRATTFVKSRLTVTFD
jgi:hypothetical protein